VQLLASGSSDCHIFLWSVSDPQRRIQLERKWFYSLIEREELPKSDLVFCLPLCAVAHKDGVTVLGWLSETELVSSGR
jgi:hypothetical protein